jgi:hypothetical protein
MQIFKIKNKKQITNIKRVSASNHFFSIIVITQYASWTDKNTIGLQIFNKNIIY